MINELFIDFVNYRLIVLSTYCYNELRFSKQFAPNVKITFNLLLYILTINILNM